MAKMSFPLQTYATNQWRHRGPLVRFRASRGDPFSENELPAGDVWQKLTYLKNTEILIFNYAFKTNEIINILKSARPESLSTCLSKEREVRLF